MKKVCLLLLTCCLSVAGFATTYINIANTALNVASNWTTTGAAGGTPASDFVTPGDIFNLSNATGGTTLTAAWTMGAVSLNISVPVTFNGGKAIALNGTTVMTNSTLTFSVAGNTLTVGDGTNPTSLAVTAGNLVFSNATATLAIAAMGTVDMQGAASVITTYTGASIANNGTFKTASTSATPFPAGRDFTAANTATGAVEFYGAGAQTIIAGTYYNLTTSGGSTKTTGIITVKNTLNINASTVNLGGAATVAGNVSIDAAGTLSTAANGLTIGGSFTNGGIFTSGTGTVTFNGTTTGKIISGNFTGTNKFNNIAFTGAGGGWQFGSDGALTTDVGGSFSVTNGTVLAPSGTLNIAGLFSHTGAGVFTHNSGTVNINGAAAQLVTCTIATIFNTLTITNGSRTITPSGTITILAPFTIPATVTLTMGSTSLTLGSDYTNSGTFTAGTGTVTFAATTTGHNISGTLSGATGKFNNIVFNGVGGGWTFNSAADVASGFTITNGSVTAPTGNLTITGSYSNSGSFTHHGGTVIFNSAAAGKTIAGSLTGTNAFNNVSFTTAGGWTFSNNADVAGNFTLSGTGTVVAPATLNVGGNFVHSAGTVANFNANGGAVNLNGSGAQSITSTIATTFSTLSFTGSTRTVSSTGTVNVLAAFTIPAAITFSPGTSSLVFSSDFTNNGTFTSGTGTVTFNATSGVHMLNGNLTGSNKFYKLVFNGVGGTWQFGTDGTNAAEVANAMTITNGTVIAPSSTLTLSGTFSNAGTFTHNSGTVLYNSALAQAVGVAAYYNLTLSGTTTAKTAAGAYTVANNMSVSTTTAAVAIRATSIGGNLTISTQTGLVTLGSAVTVAGSVLVTGTATSSVFDVSVNNYQISVGGNWTVISTTATALFNGRAGTVVFNGTGSQTISTSGGSALPNFFSIQNSNTSNSVFLNNNTTIAGNMTNDVGANLNTGAVLLTVGGDWTNNGSFTNTGTVTFNAGSTGHTISGNLSGANDFNILTFNSATGGWTISGITDVASDFNLTAGALTAPSELRIGGNFTKGATATFNHNSGLVRLNGTAAQTVPGSATSFYDLKISNTAAAVAANAAVTINDSLVTASGSTLNMATSQLLGTFFASAHSGILTTQNTTATPIPAGITWGGLVTFNSNAGQTVPVGAYNNLTLTGTTAAKNSGGASTVAGNMNVTTTTGTVALSPSSIGGNLTINTTSGVCSLTGPLSVAGDISVTGANANNVFDVSASNYPLSVAGDWSMASLSATALFNGRTGLVTFNGTGTQTISSTGGSLAANFASFRNSNVTVPISLGISTTMTGSLTIDAGAVLNVSGATLALSGDFTNNGVYSASGTQIFTIGGSWNNNGTFTAGVGTVVFNSTTAGRTLNGSMTGSNKFNDLTFSGATPGSWSFTGAADVNGDLTISGTGSVTAPSGTLNVAGDFAHNAGTFVHNSGTVNLNGATGQNIPGTAATTFGTLTFDNTTPRTISAAAAVTVAAPLTIPSDITLNMGAAPLTCISNFTNNGIYAVSGAQALSVAGDFTNTGGFTSGSGATAVTIGGNFANTGMGTFTAGTGTVTFNSSTTGRTISGNMTGTNKFNNLAFNNAAGGWDFGSNMADVGGIFTVINGVVTAPSSNLKVAGNFVHSGGTFAHNNGTVEFSGTTQTMPGTAATTFYDVNLTNAAGKVTANSAVTIDHTLASVLGDTLNMATSQLLGSLTAADMDGVLQTQCTTVTSPLPIPSGSTWGGNVIYNNGTLAQTVVPGSYNTLSMSGTTGSKTFAGAVDVAGDFNVNTTTGISTLGGTMNVAGNIKITGAAAVSIFDAGTNYQINCGGNWTTTSTTAATLFNARAGLVVFNGTGAQTISAAGGVVTPNFFSFRNSNTTAPISLNSTTAITGDLTIDTGAVLNVSAPTLTLSGNFLNNGTYNTTGSQALTVKGDYTNNGSFSAGTGSVSFSALGAGHTINGNLTGANKFNNVSFTTASPASWSFTGPADIGGDFTISGTGSVTAPAGILNVAGNFAHNAGTVANFKANGGTVNLNGTANQQIPGTIATTFSSLTIDNTFPRTINASFAMIVSAAITIPVDITLNMGTFGLTDSSDFTNNGTYNTSGAQVLTVRGNFANNGSFTSGSGATAMTLLGNYSNGGTFNANGGTVSFNANTAGHTLTGNMTGGNQFNNVSFTGLTPGAWAFGNAADIGGNFTLSGSGTVTAPSSTLTVGGNFAHNAGVFNHNSGTVELTGAADQAIPGAVATTFNALTIDNNVRTINLNKAVTVIAPFLIPSNTTFSAATNAFTDSSDFTNNGIYNIAGAQVLVVKGNFSNTGNFTSGTGATAMTISGNFANTGTFNAGTGTVLMNAATPAHTLTGNMTGANQFNNLSFTGTAPGAWSFGSAQATVAGNLSLAGSGTLTGSSDTINVGGNFSHTLGIYVANGGTIYLNGAAGQTVPGTVATTFATLAIDNTAARTITPNGNITVNNAFTIPAGITYNTAANNLTVNNSMTNNGAYNTTGAQVLTVTGDLVNTGTMTNVGAQLTTIGGSYTNSGSFTSGTGTVTFNSGIAGRTISGNLTGSSRFNNLSFTGATPGSWNFGSTAADVNGNLTISGTGTVVAPSSILQVVGNFAHTAGTFNANGGTVTLNGAGAQTMPGSATTFYDLNITNATGTVTANAATTISHSLISNAAATLNMATFQLLGSFDGSAHSGTLNTQHVATTAPVPAGLTWGGTVNFNSTAAQTVTNGSYNNLKITGMGFAKTTDGLINVAGDYTQVTTTGITTLGGALNVTGNINLTGTSGNNVLDVSASNYPIAVSGNWVVGSTTATNLLNGRAGTVTFNGTGVQGITVSAGAVVPNFFNLTYNNTANALSLATNTNVTGTLTVSANTVINPDATVAFNNAGASGAIAGSGTIMVTRTAATADYANQYKFTTNTLGAMTVEYSAAAPQFVGANTYGTLRLSGSGVKTAEGNVTVNNLLDIPSGMMLDMGAAGRLISGTAPVYSVTGTLATSVTTATSAMPLPSGITWTGTVQYANASGGQTIADGTYNDLLLSNTTGVNALGGDVTVAATLTLGKVSTGAYDLILPGGSSLSGVSSTNYVVTDGIGNLRKSISADGSYSFPVGDVTNYTPVTVDMTGTSYSSAFLGARVKPTKSDHNPNTNNYINRDWTINVSGIGSPSWSVTSASFVAGDIVGSESLMKCAAYLGSLPWIKYNIPTAHTVVSGAITSNMAEVSAIAASVPTINVTPTDTVFCSGNSIVMSATSMGGDGAVIYTWTPGTGLSATTGDVVTASPVAGGTANNIVYTVTVTDAGGSTASAYVNVTVNPQPTTITGNPTVCEGVTTALASTPSGGTWTSAGMSFATIGSSSGIVTGLSAGTSDITYGFATGCYITTQVTVNQSPTAITGTAVVCEGLTTTMNSTPGTGSWSSSATSVATVGSLNGIVLGVLAGVTNISYTLPDGCYSVQAVTVNPLPAMITGTFEVCEGLTTTLADATGTGTWSSGTTSVATIGSSNGIVSGLLAGNTAITYTLPTGCIRTVPVTVNASPSVISGLDNVCAGLSITLSNMIGSGAWTSSNTMVATVDAGGVVTGVAAGNVTISYTLPDGCFSIKSITVNPLPAAITGNTVVCEGLSNTLADASGGGTWASNNTSTATIGSTSGSLTGVAAGNTTVTYTLATGCLITAPVTVNPSPVAITGTPAMCIGFTAALTDLTAGGTWSSSNSTIATVGSTGIVTGMVAGSARITYTLPAGCFVTKLATVYPTPTAITGSLVVCEGATSTLGNTVSGGTWSSSNYAVASISLVSAIETGMAAGTATITYILSSGCSVTAVTTVNPAPHAGTITGASSVGIGSMVALSDAVSGGVWSASNANATVGTTGIVTGASAGTVTISYSYTNSCGTDVAPLVVTVSASVGITGTGYTCVGTNTTLSNATGGGVWVSSNNAVATVGSSTGIVTGVAAGTCTISYTVSSTTSTKVVTVTTSVANITGASAVCLNASTTLSCSVPGGTWLTANAAIATVDVASGLVTGVGVGTTTITYSFGTGCYKAFTFTVRPLPAAISGATSVCIGSTSALTDATSGGVLWASSATSVATIGSTTGIVTGVALGTSTITYVLSTGCYTTTVVSINSLPSAITGTANACVGATATLNNADAGGTWTSSATGTATVGSATGVVTGIVVGTATISYTLTSGCRRTQVFTVNPTPNAITGTTTVCLGSTSALSSTTTGGTWSTSTPSVATVGTSSGIVTGSDIGSSVITYTISTGCKTTTTVNVGIALGANTGTASVCTGKTTTLSNSSTGGTWSSSATATATIGSSTGIVTGVTAGTSTITYTLSGGCRSMNVVTVNSSPASVAGTNNVCVNSTVTLSDATSGGTWSSSNTALGTIDASMGVVTGIAAGTPVMTYTISNGCYSVYSVTVKALPSAIAGTAVTCVGATTTLTDATGGGLSWVSSNPAVGTIGTTSGVLTGVAAGTTTITYNLISGCYATRVATVSATASAGTITGASTVIIGNTVTLTSSVSGGTWASGTTAVATVGSSSGDVTGVGAGGTAITYTVNNGCGVATTTQAMTVTTSRPGGNSVQFANGKSLMLYPNPTDGAFTVDAPGAGTIVISTLEGMSVGKMNVSAGANALEMPKEIAAGIYMCRFTGSNGGTVVIRVVYEP